MIRSEHSASCDGCGEAFRHDNGRGVALGFWIDRDALLVALGSAGWGLLSGDTSDPDGWSVLCVYCRGKVGAA